MFASLRRRPIPEPAVLAAIFCVAFLLVVTRRPDALTNAQFYMEDGTLWYTQAHEMGGLRALLLPARGYFQTSARLGAVVALALPIGLAPLALNLLSIAVAALPPVVLCSERLSHLLPRRSWRVGAALLSVGLPNAWTTIANITHTQWYLALLAAAILLARPAAVRAWRAFDVVALALSGLSGPFAIFLLPALALKWWLRRERWTLAQAGVVLAAAAVQVGALAWSIAPSAARPELGASAAGLVALLARQLGYGLLLGQTGTGRLVASESAAIGAGASAAVTLCLVAVAAAAAAWGPAELKCLLLFAGLTLAAALVWPPIPAPWWPALAEPGFASRYFLLPMFALGASLVWMAAQRNVALRAAGVAALATTCLVGVRLDWRQPALRDYDFPRYAAEYERAAPGQKVHIPHPPGWTTVLTKR